MTDYTIPTPNIPTIATDSGLPVEAPTAMEALAEAAAEDAPPVPAGFAALELHQDVRQALDDMGYFEPTPVQREVFEPVTTGKDLLVQSRTGTGKTTAFGLPIINRVVPAVQKPQAMVLCPTRELALQVARELTQLGKHRGVIVEAVYGGAPIAKQITALKNGVHVIVGTPGRVLDHIGRRTLDCSTIATFVLDECDEMLSMGFLEDIERVTGNLPEKHQTLLFSATMPDEVSRYARRHMKAAETLSLSRDSVSVADIHHAYYIVSGIARSRDLLKIIYAEEPESAIIFCNLRDETTTVAKFLNKQGLDAEPLSSDLSQADRERVMNRMKAKNLRFLCATDVAARGIDISNLTHVINFSVPEQPEVYVHRTGRTGRAGKKGTALSLVGPRELGNFRFIRLQFGIKPEERLLPKDDIFVGRLKVPLPPVGAPQPPDPVQILIRGVPQTPSDLERQIFEKLLATASGKRVLAQLVAEKLNALSTRTASRTRSSNNERMEKPFGRRADGETEIAADQGDSATRSDRDGFGSTERSFERRDRRPRGAADEGRSGDGGRFSDGERGAMRGGSRQRYSDRSEDSGSVRQEFAKAAPGRMGDDATDERNRNADFLRESSGRDRPRFDRESRNDRNRPDRRRFDDDSGSARSDREPRGNRDRSERHRTEHSRTESNRNSDRPFAQPEVPPAVESELSSATPPAPVGADSTFEDASATHYGKNGRHARGDTIVEAVTARGHAAMSESRDTIAPIDPTPHSLIGSAAHPGDPGKSLTRDKAGVIDPTPHSLIGSAAHPGDPGKSLTRDKAGVIDLRTAEAPRDTIQPDRAGKRSRDKQATDPTEATREFWETWAETKTATVPPVPAVLSQSSDDTAVADDSPTRTARTRTHRGRSSQKSEGPSKASAKDSKRAPKKSESLATASVGRVTHPDRERGDRSIAEPSPKPHGGRLKHDTLITADDAQARLFINLGKKHGVSADDLRTLLAGPLGGDRARIGSVSLRDSHAHVRVPEDVVDAIISSINGTQHNEHDVTVERSRS